MLLGFTYSRIIGGKVAVCALGTALTLPFHLKSPNTAIFPAVPPPSTFTLADNEKENALIGLLTKSLYSGFWSKMVKFTLLPMLKQQLCYPLFANKLNLTALFMWIATSVMMYWTWVNLVILVSITVYML